MPITLSAGYAYNRTDRTASRFQFQYFRPDGALPLAVAQERPDFLLSDFNVYTYNIQLRDVSGAEGTAAYEADLAVHAGYAQVEAELTDSLRATVGVRYEDGDPERASRSAARSRRPSIANTYWLPAATLTWSFVPRHAASPARVEDHRPAAIPRARAANLPGFRIRPRVHRQPVPDRQRRCSTSRRATNIISRRDQRLSLAGFYKRIDNPIEAAAFFAGGGQLRTGFANAPQAELYGAEIEAQAYLPLAGLGGRFFATRRLLLHRQLHLHPVERSAPTTASIIGPDLQPVAANLLFEDGAPLTGQSDHLANLQIGIEDTDSLSQATFLLTYASERVTNRGPIQGLLRQPDIIERPGLRLDFVVRQEVPIFGVARRVQVRGAQPHRPGL